MKLILPLESDLEPVITKGLWQQIQQNEAWQQDERARCSVEPWYWLVNWVYTKRKDENVEGGVLERFPPWEYLRYILHKVFTEPKFAADKSRQVLMTLLLMAYAVWKCQYKKHEEIIVQTKKEDDADSQLIRERAYTIWRYQPSFIRTPIKDGHPSFCKMLFPPTDSGIYGVPKGADQIRSHNPTTVILDEGGFFEGEFEECRTTALACCKNVICVSTAYGGEWDEFINDKVAA